MKLTPQQREAVGSKGNLLLKACPGSGKTRAIVARLVRDVEALRDTAFAVACITYTNAAVGEIETRASQHLKPEDQRNYVVSTIHAFCLHQILRPFASRVPGFNGAMKVLTRDHPSFFELADKAAEEVGAYDLDFREYERFGNIGLDSEGRFIGSASEDDMIAAAAPHFIELCQRNGFIDFASILYRTLCLLRDDAEVARSVANKFRSFLIDEFQDTTEIQIDILRIIYKQGKSCFFLVGDPAQSIFGFAGARPELIDPFADEIGARRDLSLSWNFRSSPAVVEHAEALFPRAPAMTSEGENKLCHEPAHLITDKTTIDAIREDFLPAIKRMGLSNGKSAILAKSWAALYPVGKALRDFGVPVVGPGARPYKKSRLFAAVAEQLAGAILDGPKFNIRQLERAVFNAIQEIRGDSRFDFFSYEGRRTISALSRVAESLARGTDGVEWLDRMSKTTGEILSRDGWLLPSDVGRFASSVAEMITDMRHNDIDVANLSIEDLGMFASPHKAVRLMTIHESKGREFEAVAIIGVREGIIPHYNAKSAVQVEEEKRQFYVAVTRAERLLMYIYEADRRKNPPSRFLGPEGVSMILPGER